MWPGMRGQFARREPLHCTARMPVYTATHTQYRQRGPVTCQKNRPPPPYTHLHQCSGQVLGLALPACSQQAQHAALPPPRRPLPLLPRQPPQRGQHAGHGEGGGALQCGLHSHGALSGWGLRRSPGRTLEMWVWGPLREYQGVTQGLLGMTSQSPRHTAGADAAGSGRRTLVVVPQSAGTPAVHMPRTHLPLLLPQKGLQNRRTAPRPLVLPRLRASMLVGPRSCCGCPSPACVCRPGPHPQCPPASCTSPSAWTCSPPWPPVSQQIQYCLPPAAGACTFVAPQS